MANKLLTRVKSIEQQRLARNWLLF
jgi:hypothetical protein